MKKAKVDKNINRLAKRISKCMSLDEIEDILREEVVLSEEEYRLKAFHIFDKLNIE
jgi:hypothetical protein